MFKDLSLESHFSVRSGLPIKHRPEIEEERSYVAQMITPSDIKLHSHLMALPLFIDGNHLDVLLREEGCWGRLKEPQNSSLSQNFIRTSLLQRHEQRIKAERLASEAALEAQRSAKEHAQPYKALDMKTARDELEEAREAMRNFKVTLSEGGKASATKHNRLKDNLSAARTRWREARDAYYKKKGWGEDELPLPVAVGNLYRELKQIKLTKYDITKHALKTGDILLMSKGQRPSLYYFWHPFDDRLDQDTITSNHHDELVYVAHSSFVVISSYLGTLQDTAALSSWLCGVGYTKLIETKHTSSMGPWRAGKKELFKLEIDPNVFKQTSQLSRHWFREFHDALNQQLEQEVTHIKFIRDQEQILRGEQASSSLYNMTDLKSQLIRWLLNPSGQNSDGADPRLELNVSESDLRIQAPRFDELDRVAFDLGLKMVQDQEVIKKIKTAIDSMKLGFADFKPEFLKLVLYVGSVRSMELAQGIPWGPKSTIWHRLMPLKQAIEDGDMYDAMLSGGLGTPARSDDPLIRLDEQMITLVSQIQALLELSQHHRAQLQQLAQLTSMGKLKHKKGKGKSDSVDHDRLFD